jgi:hypothetical protein
VSINEGLDITCLKTENLKITCSIVAAVREQRGRFLENNTRDGTWYDIGDRKAIEKTSQALREGQPKLRQMGTTALLKSQLPDGADLYRALESVTSTYCFVLLSFDQ